MTEVASHTATFLFTDIEGSTRLLKRLGDGYGAVLAEHGRLLRDAFANHGGRVVDTQGDSFFVAFPRARDAVLAAVEAQRALAGHEWPDGAEVRVRMGIHTGGAALADERYLGLPVHRAARVSDAGHGGQILLSEATERLLEEEELPAIELRDLGRRRLKDIDHPVRIFQVDAPGLPRTFPPLRTLGSRRPLRLYVTAGALLSVAAVSVAYVATRSEPAVGAPPNSVAIIDPRDNELVGHVAVGARPAAVAVGPDAVWVANLDDKTLSRIDPDARRVQRTVALGGGFPSDIAVGAGAVWVADGPFSSVTRISPQVNDVTSRIEVDWCGQTEAHIAVGEGAVWFVCETLVRIDPATNRRQGLGSPGVRPSGIAAGLGSVWVTTSGENRIARISPRSNEVTEQVPVGADPRAIVIGQDAVWAVAFAGGSVSRLDVPGAGLPLSHETIRPVGDGPLDIAVGSGAVWVANGDDGTVSRIDPRTNEVVATIRVGNRAAGIAAGADAVWVALQAPTASATP